MLIVTDLLLLYCVALKYPQYFLCMIDGKRNMRQTHTHPVVYKNVCQGLIIHLCLIELLTELPRVAGRSCVSNPKTALIPYI